MEVYPQLVISSSNFVLAATANKVFFANILSMQQAWEMGLC